MARFKSFSDLNKPLRFNLSEWTKENNFHLRNAEEQCKLAERIKVESERVCENVVDILEKNKKETNASFSQRINEEEYKRDEIECLRTQIQVELEPLAYIKSRVEAAIRCIESCGYKITQKCIILREERIGIDLVNDEVEKALLQEMTTIEDALEVLRRCLAQVEETQRLMRSSLYQLNQDLHNKFMSLRIDKEAQNLKETNVGLAVYQRKQPLDPATLTVEEWTRFTDETLKNATKKLAESRPLRVYIDNVLKQIEHDLHKQDDAVNEAFRQRIEQVKKGKDKLESRHFEVVRQANDMSLSIAELEKAIADKEGYLALAHTRLDKRAQRPGAELVRDEVNNCLRNEVLDIKAVVAQLRQKLAQAQAVQRQLLKTQVQLEEDINIKINSLKIDEVDCMTLRQSIQHPVL